MPHMWMDVDTALSEVPVNLAALVDDTDFKSKEESVAYNAAGMDLVWNFVTTAGAFTQTAVTPTTGGNYDWAHQGNGMYSIEIPASGGASINNDTEGFGWFTGVATGILPWSGPVIGFRAAGLNNALIDDAYSTTRGLAGTALPAAAADAAGGLPISDAGGLDLDAQIGTKINDILTDTGTTLQGEVDGIQADTEDIQARLPAALVSGRIDASVGAMASGVVTATAIAADAIGASELAADAVAEIADAVWDEARSGHTAAGSFGQGAASVQGNVTGSVASVTGAVGSVTGAVGSVTGAVGSVTGAVGSVTGNVGGNVTGSVGSVAANGIAAASIATGAITAAKFAAGAIDAAAIATGAIDADAIADNAIDAGAIASDAITAAKIADGAIDAATFAAGAITATAIAPNAIGASELATDAVTEIVDAIKAAIASGSTTWNAIMVALAAGMTTPP